MRARYSSARTRSADKTSDYPSAACGRGFYAAARSSLRTDEDQAMPAQICGAARSRRRFPALAGRRNHGLAFCVGVLIGKACAFISYGPDVMGTDGWR